jgi:type IV conjugative transfer system coupling protein TraD
MFRQIAYASLKISLCFSIGLTILLNLSKGKSLDWEAYISLQKIRFLDLADFTSLSKSSKERTVEVTMKGNLYELSKVKALRNKYLLNNEQIINDFLKGKAFFIFQITSLLYFLIFIAWWLLGIRSSSAVINDENQILTASYARDYLRRNKIASDIVLGKLPLVINSETKHILVMGTTGAGKTNCFHTILKQVREKQQPALIIDLNGDMIARYYNPKRGDIIINPFDQRGVAWDLWDELVDPQYISIIASSIFAGKGSSYDEMWNNSSKQVFIDAVEYLIETGNRSSLELYKILTTYSLKDVSSKLQGRAGGALMDPISDKTAQSIRANIIAFTKWLKFLDIAPEKYSTRKWMESVDNNKEGWLFLSCPPDMPEEFQPIFSIVFELVLRRIMRLGKDYERRVWIVTDELPANGKIPSLKTAAAQIRKYGGCILSAIQSMDQLYDVYGRDVAKILLSQFNTKIIFRTDDVDAARILGQIAGEIELKEISESVSYGAHEMRDGVQIGQQKRSKLALTAKDLARLADLEAVVKLPAPGLQFVKIKMDIVKDKDKEQSFIERIIKHERLEEEACLEPPLLEEERLNETV